MLLIAAIVYRTLRRTQWALTSGSSVDPSLVNGVGWASALGAGGESLIYASMGTGFARARASFLHDVPLRPKGGDNLVTVVCEVPRGRTAKLEVSTGEKYTPLRQDLEADGKTQREYAWPAPGNYGMLPQTLSSPTVKDYFTGLGGDGDPLDAVDLSPTPCEPGTVFAARVLGALALIDGGETDYKIFVMRADSVIPASIFADIADVSSQLTSFDADARVDADDAPVQRLAVDLYSGAVTAVPATRSTPYLSGENLSLALAADAPTAAFASAAAAALRTAAGLRKASSFPATSAAGPVPGGGLPFSSPSTFLWLDRVALGPPLSPSEAAIMRLSVHVWLALRLAATRDWFMGYKAAAARRDQRSKPKTLPAAGWGGAFLDAKTAMQVVEKGAEAYAKANAKGGIGAGTSE